MSRIGKKPIEIADGVKVKFIEPLLEVSGKGGTLTKEIPSLFSIEIKDKKIFLSPKNGNNVGSLYGLTRTLISNMVKGVSEGYSVTLELRGVGYRAQALSQHKISLLVGYSHPVEVEFPKLVSVKVEGNNKIILTSPDKELLGVEADKVRKIRPPDCYKGKGIRYLDEEVKLKQGKTVGGIGGAPGASGSGGG